ncbi:MAG: transcription termination/antitermination NusG family protein [Ruthenibacterium sp.]
MEWYVLQVMTGKERAVCTALKKAGFTARAPSEIITIRRGGKEVPEEKLLFPSYVCTLIDYSANIFHAINKLPNVIRFLGMEQGVPAHLGEDDCDWIAFLSGIEDEPIPLSTVEFDSHGTPHILSGALLQFSSNHTIKIDRRQRRAKVTIRLLGEQRHITMGIVPTGNKEAQHESL